MTFYSFPDRSTSIINLLVHVFFFLYSNYTGKKENCQKIIILIWLIDSIFPTFYFLIKDLDFRDQKIYC